MHCLSFFHRPLKMVINWSLIDIGSKMKINNTRNADAVSRHHQFSSQLSDISSFGTFSLSKWKVHLLHISSSLDLAIFHNKFNFSHSTVSLFSIQFNLSRHNQWLLTTFTIIKTLQVRGPSGPQLLVGGPSGQLDFVLRALRRSGRV